MRVVIKQRMIRSLLRSKHHATILASSLRFRVVWISSKSFCAADSKSEDEKLKDALVRATLLHVNKVGNTYLERSDVYVFILHQSKVGVTEP